MTAEMGLVCGVVVTVADGRVFACANRGYFAPLADKYRQPGNYTFSHLTSIVNRHSDFRHGNT
jgi:hypothetical protein